MNCLQACDQIGISMDVFEKDMSVQVIDAELNRFAEVAVGGRNWLNPIDCLII